MPIEIKHEVTATDSTRSFSAVQKRVMLEFVAKHPDLKTGRFSSTFTLADAQKLWKSLAVSLNAMEGANKNWKQWRKSYQDWKTRAKSAVAKQNKSMRKTGGGPPESVKIDIDDDALLQAIDPLMVHGIDGTEESEANFDLPPTDGVPNEEWDILNGEIKDMKQDTIVGSTESTSESQIPGEDLKRQNSASGSEAIPPGQLTKDEDMDIAGIQIDSAIDSTDDQGFVDNGSLVNDDDKKSADIKSIHNGEENKENNGNDLNLNEIDPDDKKEITIKAGLMSRRSNSSRRLDQAINQTDTLTSLMRTDTLNKKMYYDEKLKIMRENYILKERGIAALESIARALERQYCSL